MTRATRLSTYALALWLAFGWGAPSRAWAASEVQFGEQLRQRLGVLAHSSASIGRVKIAVLDNGFEGFAPGRGMLPASAELVAGPVNGLAPTAHGLGMAQIAWAMTGKTAEGPKFYLVNANGFSNLKAAIEFVIREKVDLVLYSQVWSFGSNYDGTGFINAQVSRALDAGVLWANAAGNFGGAVREGAILSETDAGAASREPRWLRPGGRDGLRFVNRLDDNDVELVLSWNDFGDSENDSTRKDLDLLVYAQDGRLVGSSELRQQGGSPSDPASGLSSYARERVVLRGLDRGTYTARIRAQSQNFGASDRYRLVVDAKPASTEFLDRGEGREIFPPADHPGVLTVGDGSPLSSVGPTADGRVKPDVRVGDATVRFTNGVVSAGSSSAAAIVAGCVAVLKAERASLTQTGLLRFAASLGAAAPGDGAADLMAVDAALVPPVIRELIPPGGRLTAHRNGHFVILSPTDPFTLSWALSSNAHRDSPGDSLVVSLADRRWASVSPAKRDQVQRPLIELRLVPRAASAGEWRMPSFAEL